MHEGRASLTTAIINSLGYGIMIFSSYKPTAWFGGLLALTMVVAFLAEVLVVPAVITLVPADLRRSDRSRGSDPRHEGEQGRRAPLQGCRCGRCGHSARGRACAAQVDGHVVGHRRCASRSRCG